MGAAKPYALLETRAAKTRHESLFFAEAIDAVAFEAGDDPRAFFDRIDAALQRGLWVCGYFTYEFGYVLQPQLTALLESKRPAGPLAWVAFFDAPNQANDPEHWRDALGSAGAPGGAYSIENLRLGLSREDYYAAIARIKAYLRKGETYQTNFTHKCRFTLTGSTTALYGDLRRRQEVSYSACLYDGNRTIMSLSPELFFHYDGAAMTSVPMKGTVRRGRSVQEDESLMAWLAADEKNRAENVMIVDMVRNDLGRIATPGGVDVPRLFDVERYRTLLQMTSTVTARLKQDTSWYDRFEALFPSASITGAPKLRTMQIINELEKEPRGVYTGAIGYFAPDGRACFNVAIRTLVVDAERHAEMGIGSGIVYDSDAAAEYDECLLKARFLTDDVPSFALIETMLLEDGEIRGLDLHMQRLGDSARYFDYDFPAARIREQLGELCARAQAPRSKVRLLLHNNGRVEIESSPVGPPPASVCVRLSKTRTDSANPFYYHKTTHRPLYQQERDRAGDDEVIFLNERGEVSEGTITNVFAHIDGRLYTPPLSCGVLAGTLRQRLLAAGECHERILRLEDIRGADQLFVGNAVWGLCEAKLYAG